MLFSSPGDVVLVRSDKQNREMQDRVLRIAEHLTQCGMPVGQVHFHSDLEAAVHDYADSYFLCPATFGSVIVSALGNDPEAVRHRNVIRTLLNKWKSHRSDKFRHSGSRHVFLDKSAAVARFASSSSGPTVLKAAVGAGGGEIAFVDSPSEIDTKWRTATAEWGAVLGEARSAQARRRYRYTSLQTNGAVRMILACRDPETIACGADTVWYRDGIDDVNLGLARTIVDAQASFARDNGGSTLHLCQDWLIPPASYVETNPRLGSASAITAFLQRGHSSPDRVKNVVLGRNTDITLADLIRDLSPFQFSTERGAGVIVYSFGNYPYPHVLALLVNDLNGTIEAALRKLVASA